MTAILGTVGFLLRTQMTATAVIKLRYRVLDLLIINILRMSINCGDLKLCHPSQFYEVFFIITQYLLCSS